MQIKNSKYKRMISLILIMFLVLIITELIPRTKNTISMSFDLYKKNAIMNNENKSEEKIKNLSIENRMLKGEVKNNLNGYDRTGNMSSTISLLDSVAVLSHVKLSSVKPQKTYRKNNFIVQPVELNMNSSYERIFNFVRFLENASKVISIKDLNITSKENSKDSLAVRADLEIYLSL